ncbi:hypothetical protein INT45_000910, partial [Circinella minor]
KNNVAQTTTQVQAVAVQAVATGSATAVSVHEQLSGITKATHTQIETALDNCQVDVEIVVEEKAEKKSQENIKDIEIESKEEQDNSKKIVTGAIVSVGGVEYAKLAIQSWFNKLMLDVSECAAVGGTEEEVEAIVSDATESIEDTIDDIADEIKVSSSVAASVDKINATLEWAKGMVIQGSHQVEAIGVQAIASGHASIGSIREQMAPLIHANTTQIETALSSCDVAITINVDHIEKIGRTEHAVTYSTGEPIYKKIDEKTVTKVKKPVHKKPTLSTGEAAEIIAGSVISVGAVGYLKSTITAWCDKLTNVVAKRAEQGGDNASSDIEAIIAKANAEIDVEFSTVITKSAKTDNESAIKLKETIESTRTTLTQLTTHVQTVAIEAIATGNLDSVVIQDKLTGIVKSATIEVGTVLDKCDSKIDLKVEKKKASDVKQAIEAAGQVTVGAVDYAKVTISSWYNKLIDDISLCTTNEEVEATIAKSNAIVEDDLKVIIEKTKNSDASTSISDQIVSTTEWAKNVVLEGSNQIKIIGVEIVAGSTSAKDSIAELIESTEKQIDIAYSKCDSSLIIEVDHTKVSPEHVHKVVKHDSKKSKIKKHQQKPIKNAKDTCKKTEKKDDHHHTAKVGAGVVAGAVVTVGVVVGAGVVAGAVVTVGVVGYVKSTISSWFDKLNKDVADRVEKGGDNVNADIEVIVSKAKTGIDTEFASVVTKTDEAKDKVSADKIKETIEWAKNNVAQTTTQVQAVAVQAVATGSATAVSVHEQLSSVTKATHTQIETALDNCQVDVEIEVEEKTEKIVSETKKSEETEEKITEEADKIVKHDDKKTEKKDDDHHHAAKVGAGVVAGAVVTVGVVGYVKSTISSWFDKLNKDVADRVEKGGDNVNADIEVIVSKAKTEIDTKFASVVTKTDEAKDKVSADKIKETIEWAKNNVAQTTTQVQAVAVQAVATGSATAVSVHEQLSGITKATHTQIETALDNCQVDVEIEVEEKTEKIVSETKKSEETEEKITEQADKIVKHDDKKTEKKDDHHHHAAKVGAGVVAGAVVTVGVVGYVKSAVHSWFNKLTKDIAECAEKGGDNVNEDIEVIIAEATENINSEFSHIVHKTDGSPNKESAEKLKATLEWANSMVSHSTVQVHAVAVQAIAAGRASAADIHEELIAVAESTTTQIDTALGSCKTDLVIEVAKKNEKQKSSVQKRKKSVDVTVGVVDYVKITINTWYRKLANDISSCNTNDEVESTIIKANASIEADLQAVTEKTKKSDASTSVSEQIVSTTEWAKDVALEGSNQLKIIGVQIVSGSTSAKDNIAELIESTEKQIDVAYDKCDSSLTIEVEHTKVSPEHVTKIVKHDAKKAKAKKDQKKAEKQKKHARKPKDSDQKKECNKPRFKVDTDNKSENKHVEKVTEGSIDILAIIHAWYTQLTLDVSTYAKKGRSSQEIEKLVADRKTEITEKLQVVEVTVTETVSDKTKLEGFKSIIQWAQDMVIQGAYQVQAIGVQSAATSSSGIEQMTIATTAIEEQISIAVQPYTEIVSMYTENIKKAKKNEEKAPKHDYKKKDNKTLEHVIEGSLAIGAAAGAVAAIGAAKKKSSEKKTTTKKETSVQTISPADQVEIAKKTAKDTQDWFYKLIVVRFTHLLESSADRLYVNSETEHIIGKAEIEVSDKIGELQHGTSSVHLEEFFGHLRTTFSDQLATIKTTILEGPWQNASEQESALYSIATRLNEQIAVHVAAVEAVVAEEEQIVVGENDVVTEIKEERTTIIESDKKTAVVAKKQPIQFVEVAKIETIKTDVNGWFIRLIERIKACRKQNEGDVSLQVTTIITEAQGELTTLIKSAKSRVSTETDVEYNVSATLETIYTTAILQANISKNIAMHGVNVDSQLNNVVIVANKQVDKLLQVHIVNEKTGESSYGAAILDKKETKGEIQARVQKEVTLAIQDTKTKLSGWLDLLIKNIHTSIQREGCDVPTEIQHLLEEANQQVDDIIKTVKAQIVSSGDEQILLRTDATAAGHVAYARNQALYIIDQIKITLYSQTASLKQVVARIDSNDIATVDERVFNRIALIKDRLNHSLDQAASVTIAAAFEGKTVSWVETTEMPVSFAGVRAIAFDLVGTITDFHSSFATAWSAVIKNKKAEALHKINGLEFSNKWYALFLERKGTNGKQQDQVLLRIILIELLASYQIKEDAFTAAQLDKLVLVWRRSSLFKEVTAGIKRVKHLNHGTVTVSFSQAFQTRTMIDLARHGCLCWHAQFGADMVSAESPEAFVNNVSDLLALENTKELAIVSADPNVLRAAKSSGAHTVLIHRSEHTSTEEFDFEVDGIDMLAESFEAMIDQKEAQKQESSTTVGGRTWFQRVVDTASSALY